MLSAALLCLVVGISDGDTLAELDKKPKGHEVGNG